MLSERSALVTGWVGGETIDIMVMRDAGGQWQLNGRCIENVAGCSDIDLNFSPSTNLLPIRRLNQAVGATALVRAAGLRFPSFSISLTPGWLRDTIATKALGGKFVAELTVDEAGLVIDYGSIWNRETVS